MKLSLITINYNNASGLEKTIRSVLTQKNLKADEFEYIIIDGGSTDGSVDLIKNFSERAERGEFPQKISKWVSEKDSGIYNAMNKGIKIAGGSIIGLLNSGDEAVENAYDDILLLHKNQPEAVLYGGMNFCENGKFKKVYSFCAEDLPRQMIAHPASFVPKSVYEKYGFYDESFRSSADWDLFIKFYKTGVQFVYTNKIYLNFDCGGISNSNEKLVIKEDKRIIKKYGLKTRKQKLMEVYKILTFIIPGIFLYPVKKFLGSRIKK